MNENLTAGGHPELLAEIRTLQSQFEVFRLLRRVTALFSYSGFLVVRLPKLTSLQLGENSIITNWPTGFLDAFDRMQLLATSPLLARMRTTTIPYEFDVHELAGERPQEDVEKARKLYSEFDFVRGIGIPVHDINAGRGVIILIGNRGALAYAELAEITVIAIHVYQRLMDVASVTASKDQPLTERELDCLTWTAEGKTSADIAAILSLSEHTVNHYLNRATKKLDTVNRTQAVAKALRRGLIA